MKKRKRAMMPFAGTVVILMMLTAALVFFIRGQPDPGRKEETATQKKEVSDESSKQRRRNTEEARDEDSVLVHGTGHLYYLDPEGDPAFERRLTLFIKSQGIRAKTAEVMEYRIDDRDRENEEAQFFLRLDDERNTIISICFEKTTGAYRFLLYDGTIPDPAGNPAGSGREEKEIPESREDVAVNHSTLSITDPEGALERAADMEQLKKELQRFLRSEEEGRRNLFVGSVTETENGYKAVLCFETVRQDGRNVEATYDGVYHFRFI